MCFHISMHFSLFYSGYVVFVFRFISFYLFYQFIKCLDASLFFKMKEQERVWT